jgi:hypothetical protein
MSTLAILQDLVTKQLATEADLGRLRSAGDHHIFLTKLVEIFESKATLFLRMCEYDVKKTLQATGVNGAQLNALTLQKTVESAFSVFFEKDKYSALPTLRLVLSHANPDLLPSLGLNVIGQQTDELSDIVRPVFVGYAARHQLFRSVNAQALEALCNETAASAPRLFPPYLFNAFQLENFLSREMMMRMRGQPPDQTFQLLSDLIQANSVPTYECALGVTLYLGAVASPHIPSALRPRYFSYLNTPQTQLDFAAAVAQGYVDEMIQPPIGMRILRLHREILNSPQNAICLPAMSLLGLTIEIDLDAINQQKKAVEQAIQTHQSNVAAIPGKIEAARKANYDQIDQWRAGIPDRPVNFGIIIGFPFS